MVRIREERKVQVASTSNRRERDDEVRQRQTVLAMASTNKTEEGRGEIFFIV